MDFTLLIELITAVIAGGAVTSLITIRETKKGMKLDNVAKDEENKNKSIERWSNLCNELQDQVEGLNERLDKKDARIMELEDRCVTYRGKIDQLSTELTKATLLKCNKLQCVDRRPPFGYSELTTDELMDQGIDKDIE